MSAIAAEIKKWHVKHDDEGHRTYTGKFLVTTDDPEDGPKVAADCVYLPEIGDYWAYGNDSDTDALMLPTLEVQPNTQGERCLHWMVTTTFSTKPGDRCQTDEVGNPLLEPVQIRGGFNKFTKEGTKDRHGNAIKTSSHEMFRGAAVEFEDNRPTVAVTMNLAVLPITTFAPLVDTVNDATLWGFAARRVKLSNVSWERKMYGTCTYYYTVTYEFHINDGALGWDRDLIDEGTKVLVAGGNRTDPRDFVAYKDANGENTRVLLNGLGEPLANGASPAAYRLEYYEEEDFTTLGLPTGLPATL